MTRSIEQQFSAKKAIEIRRIQGSFQSLQFQTGAAQYYRSEIVKCLDAGLLLAAVQVTSALLELFARDLLIVMKYKMEFSQRPKPIDHELGRIEKEIEDGRPRFDFNTIILDLVKHDFIDSKDGDEVYEFYKSVRTPLHHGLTRRFVRISSEFVIDEVEEDPLSDLFLSHNSRFHIFEEIIEDNALNHLTLVVNFIAKYLPTIDEFYSGWA